MGIGSIHFLFLFFSFISKLEGKMWVCESLAPPALAGACGMVFHLSVSSPKCFFGDTSLCSADTRFWWKDPPPDFHTQWSHSLVRDGLKPAAFLFCSSTPSAPPGGVSPPSYWRSTFFCRWANGFPCCALWISAFAGTLWGQGSMVAPVMRGQEEEIAMSWKKKIAERGIL